MLTVRIKNLFILKMPNLPAFDHLSIEQDQDRLEGNLVRVCVEGREFVACWQTIHPLQHHTTIENLEKTWNWTL